MLLHSLPRQIRLILGALTVLVAGLVAEAHLLSSADAAGANIVFEATTTPANTAKGSFRVQCGFSHVSHNDPIVHPGKPGASHRHYFYGNESVNAFTTANSIRQSGNSTCHGGTLNRSGYWMPAVFDGDGKPVSTSQTHFYYKSGQLRPSEIEAFPQGLRMVSKAAPIGQPTNTNRVRWLCTPDASKSDEVGGVAWIPKCARGKFLQASVLFPQCWNGRDLDSADHLSHMAWPENVPGSTYAKCPASHPRELPLINLNFLYRVTDIAGTSGWHVAGDQPNVRGGRTLHADWMDGWDRDVVNTFVDNCVRVGRQCRPGNLGNNTALRRFEPGAGAVGATAAGAPGLQIAGSEPLLRPKGQLTSVAPSAGSVQVKGFFRDPNSTGSVQVHVYRRMLDVPNASRQRIKIVAANKPDPAGNELLRQYPFELHNRNYRLNHSIATVKGRQEICVWVRDWQLANQKLIKKGRWIPGCHTVEVIRGPGDPVGEIGEIIINGNRSFGFWGWAEDPNTKSGINVEVRVDGQLVETVTANKSTPANHAGHGFSGHISNVTPGLRVVCMDAINVGAGKNFRVGKTATSSGCQTITVR